MGVLSNKNLMWKASSVSVDNLKMMKIGNRLDVDLSLIACRISMRLTKGIESNQVNLAKSIAIHLKHLSHNCGFHVTIILDGDKRPDCKRASWDRQKKRTLDKINSIVCRLKAVESTNKEALDDANEYNKECVRLEKAVANGVPILDADFRSNLKNELQKINAFEQAQDGGFVNRDIIQSLYQADSMIAYRFIQGDSDIIYSSDSDFTALIGSKCIMLKDVVEQGKELTKFVIGGSCNDVMMQLKRKAQAQ